LKKYKILFFIFFLFLIQTSYAQHDKDSPISPAKLDELTKTTKEAYSLYSAGQTEFNNGNPNNAYLCYKKSLDKIEQLKLDDETNKYLTTDFNNLFENLKNILEKIKQSDKTSLEDYSKYKSIIHSIKVDDPIVQKYINIHTKNSGGREAFQKCISNFLYYKPMIEKIITENNLPHELIYLPMVESFYSSRAESNAGAVGLWQFMPSTARYFGLKVNYWLDERRDPIKSTYAALKYLKYLYELFDDWELALASYNRGHIGIQSDLRFSKATNFTSLQNRNAIPKETNNFVPKFLAYKTLFEHSSDYGFKIDTNCLTYNYDTVTLNQTVDLEIAAKCSSTTLQNIKDLNPEIIAWCTPPNYINFELKVPKGTKDSFLIELSKIPDTNPSRGIVKYKVERGDTLDKIARKFNTNAKDIKSDNNIKNANHLGIGKKLMIRPGRKYYKNKNL
jgi:membrane-bound lytic murein transglycosylase D